MEKKKIIVDKELELRIDRIENHLSELEDIECKSVEDVERIELLNERLESLYAKRKTIS